MLKPDLPHFDDPEGNSLPPNCAGAVDAHVHVFPGKIFESVWKWFDEHAWRIRYRMKTCDVFQFLLDKGLSHLIALQYAHRPGISEALNRYLAEQIRPFKGKVSGMATVFPGEPGASQILKDAFSLGLSGIKLHAHVQCFDMNTNDMDVIYQACSDNQKPIIMHVGQEPKSTAYKCDPYEICNARKLETAIRNYPDVKFCVPHLGFGELSAYRRLIEKYDNLWTDTTMVLTDYFPINKINLADYRIDRVMYGSDFPNIPYEWDRELKMLSRAGLKEKALRHILQENARAFFDL